MTVPIGFTNRSILNTSHSLSILFSLQSTSPQCPVCGAANPGGVGSIPVGFKIEDQEQYACELVVCGQIFVASNCIELSAWLEIEQDGDPQQEIGSWTH